MVRYVTPMCLHISRRLFESAVHIRLFGRALGIIYWVINILYLTKESFVITEYYCKYLLSQDISEAEYIQVIEIMSSSLIVVNITILLAVERVVLMIIIFLQEKSLLTSRVCSNCKPKEWQRKRLKWAVHVGTAWLKAM